MLGRAPQLSGAGPWLNRERGRPLELAELRGRVVLVDFWTYTWVNCLRTLPYLRAWDAKYRDLGLTVIGVHAPEFPFERSTANVKAAVQRNRLRYAVVQDNDYAIWNALYNQYWPAKYLIDAAGNIRYAHFGEGSYDETEAAIRSLLRIGEVTVRAILRSPRTPLSQKPRSPATSLRRAIWVRYVRRGSPTGGSRRDRETSGLPPAGSTATSWSTRAARGSTVRGRRRWTARRYACASARAGSFSCSDPRKVGRATFESGSTDKCDGIPERRGPAVWRCSRRLPAPLPADRPACRWRAHADFALWPRRFRLRLHVWVKKLAAERR